MLIALLLLGDATRAIAPWLLPPLVGFVWASIAGIDLLALLVERRSPWLMGLPSWLGAHTVMIALHRAALADRLVAVEGGRPRAGRAPMRASTCPS